MIDKAWFSKPRKFFRYHRSSTPEVQLSDDFIRYTDSFEVQKQPSKSKLQFLAQKLSRTSCIRNVNSASLRPHKNLKSGSIPENGSVDEIELKSNPWFSDKPYLSCNSTPSNRSQGNEEPFQANPGNGCMPEERDDCDVKSNDSDVVHENVEDAASSKRTRGKEKSFQSDPRNTSTPEEFGDCDMKSNDLIEVDGNVEDAPKVTTDRADPISTTCIDTTAANSTNAPTISGPYNSIISSHSTLTDNEETSADKMSLNQSVTQVIEGWEIRPDHDETGFEVLDSRADLCFGGVFEGQGAPLADPQHSIAKNDDNEIIVSSVHGAQPPPGSGFVGKVADGAKKNMLHVYGSCIGCTAAVADRVLDDETNESQSNITLDSALNSTTVNSELAIDEQVQDVLMLVGGFLYSWLPEPSDRAMDVGASMLDLAVDISKAKLL
ncbi:hypothetical protein ACHAW6_007206 [Cyclotella cf. meneghiniana]